MPTVYLGNSAAVDRGEPVEGEQVTTVNIPDDYTAAEQMAVITAADGVWRNHSDGDGPDWVESDDPALAQRVGAYYDCPVGRPEVTEEGDPDQSKQWQ